MVQSIEIFLFTVRLIILPKDVIITFLGILIDNGTNDFRQSRRHIEQKRATLTSKAIGNDNYSLR